METVFKQAPDGFYDREAGSRLRDEIYAPGGSRDVQDSIRAFLGRERSLEPFLKKLGIKAN
ncbi:MAG: Zn-dependent oligopeptidase [Limisphaerales bacterium]|jgi:Zn-dependent oligopeptidase